MILPLQSQTVPPSEQHAADQGSAENGYDFLGACLAVAPGNLGDDDVAVLDLAPDDFVNVVHLASPIRHIFSSSRVDFSCVAGCGACPP